MEEAQRRGVAVTFAELRQLLPRLAAAGTLDAYQYVPSWVVDFMSGLARGRRPSSVLDPWAGLGLVLLPIVDAVSPKQATGLILNTEDHAIAEKIDTAHHVRWQVGDPFSWLANCESRFDLIVSSPPFGLRWQRGRSAALDDMSEKDDIGSLLLLAASRLLTDGGVACFVTYPGFVKLDQRRSVYANLGRHGLYLEAYISLPPGAFSPVTSIETALVVVRRGNPMPVFAGQLTNDTQRADILLANYLERTPGRELALGQLVPSTEFRSYRYIELGERVDRIAQRTGLTPVTLASLAYEINLERSSGGFSDVRNAIYVPIIGQNPVVTAQAEMVMKPQNYAQVVLRPEDADAAHVAFAMNSELGRLVRERHKTGAIPRLTKQAFATLPVYLPPPEVQKRVAAASARPVNLENEVVGLRKKLSSNPMKVSDVERALEQINRTERFEDWLDTLPFPLASVLWTYHARTDDTRRYEHLLHFFEALAEFWATVLLSGFSTDPGAMAAERQKISEVLQKQHLSFERSTFGTWVRVVEILSSAGRSLLNAPELDKKQQCRGMFRCLSDEVLAWLFASDAIAPLQLANKIRNDVDAHGGIVGDDAARQFLLELEQHLSEVRASLSGTWENFTLVRPGPTRVSHGMYHYKAQLLAGSRTPFRTVELELSEHMDDDYLYLIAAEETRPLRLLPLVKVMPSPATAENACYFYNRREAGRIRFVSYHFDREARIENVFQDTDDALRSITGTDVAGSDA
jgi:predicted RNA methylase